MDQSRDSWASGAEGSHTIGQLTVSCTLLDGETMDWEPTDVLQPQSGNRIAQITARQSLTHESLLNKLRLRVPFALPSPLLPATLDSWLQQAEFAFFGHSPSSPLSTSSHSHDISQREKRKAIRQLQKAAEHGHTSSQAVLGFLYEFGIGVAEQDFQAAEKLYLASAKAGNGLSQTRLTFLRKYGRPGVKIDRLEADEWVQRVNSRGEEAILWFKDMSERGNNPAAAYALGVCYHDGVGVIKSPERAVELYQKSAAAGQPRGEGILGYCTFCLRVANSRLWRGIWNRQGRGTRVQILHEGRGEG
jgi:hypothetical protein